MARTVRPGFQMHQTLHTDDIVTSDTQASYHCPTCKRPFKRLDLLQRHEKRNVCYESKKRRRTSEASASEDYSPPIHRVSSPSPNAAPNYTLPNTSLLEQMTILNPVPDLMGTNNNTDWGFGLWPPDPWESLLHDTLAPPFNEPVIQMDMPWNILTPRLQESAERGGVSVASTALVARLQIAFPVSCPSPNHESFTGYMGYVDVSEGVRHIPTIPHRSSPSILDPYLPVIPFHSLRYIQYRHSLDRTHCNDGYHRCYSYHPTAEFPNHRSANPRIISPELRSRYAPFYPPSIHALPRTRYLVRERRDVICGAMYVACDGGAFAQKGDWSGG